MAIERFREAQNSAFAGFDTALEEMRAGQKRSHWIWYVFPQLDGLGRSSMARQYALRDVAEAEEFLRDPELRGRYHTIAGAVWEQVRTGGAASLRAVMGSDIDTLKLVSSLTLFRHVARTLHQREGLDEYRAVADVADGVLAIAAREAFPPCASTLQRLRS